MDGKEAIGIGVALSSWSVLLLFFNQPLSRAYEEVWPKKFGGWNRGKGWHVRELLLVASILLIVGVVILIRGQS